MCASTAVDHRAAARRPHWPGRAAMLWCPTARSNVLMDALHKALHKACAVLAFVVYDSSVLYTELNFG